MATIPVRATLGVVRPGYVQLLRGPVLFMRRGLHRAGVLRYDVTSIHPNCMARLLAQEFTGSCVDHFSHSWFIMRIDQGTHDSHACAMR